MIPIPVHGQTRVENGSGVITVTTVYPTSPEDLWDAITVPERLARWFGELVPRGDDTSTYDASLVTGWSGTARVDQCDPPRLLRVALLDDEPSETAVTATLDVTESGTRLTIEERGLPADDLSIYVAGWHAQLDRLHADLSGAPSIEWRPRWQQLRETYRLIPSDED